MRFVGVFMGLLLGAFNVLGLSSSKSGKITDCLPIDRKADFCIELYEPVCGWKEKEKKTYSNRCHACKDPEVKGTTPGECPS